MKFPKDAIEREQIYRGLIRSCDVSRADRGAQYQYRRAWYLRGSDGSDAARYNKLRGAIRDLTGFLYAAEMTRFGVKVPRRFSEELLEEAEVARDVFAEAWHNAECPTIMKTALEWACVYDTMLVKDLRTAAGPEKYLVEPSMFGVLNEALPFLDRQEAFCEWYAMGVSELERKLRGHPDGTALFNQIASQATAGTLQSAAQPLTAAQSRLVMSMVTPNMVGTAGIGTGRGPEPQVDEPTVEMAELWVWDDDLGEKDDKGVPTGNYRVVDVHIGTDLVVWDRQAPEECENSHPYTAITPDPDLRYFWGHSIVEPLIPLQRWREDMFNKIGARIDLQLKPPRTFTGWGGLNDERVNLLNRPGGWLNNPMLSGKVETYSPEMPPDAFAEVKEIDRMFSERLGLKGLLEGQADPNLRSTGQAGILTSLSSAGIRQQSLVIEDQIEEAATKFWRVLRQTDDTPYVTPGEKEFLLSQLPEGTVIKVAAHTSSPLYAEQLESKAANLYKAGLLTGEDLVYLLDMPFAEILGPKARRLQEAQAKGEQEKDEMRTAIDWAKATRPRSR